MARRILVAIVLMLGAANAAQAIECLGLPDFTKRGTWSWQFVDGKFCWYLGDNSVPKEQLRWPGSEQPQQPQQAQPKKLAALPAGQKIQCHAEIDKSKPGRWSWRTVEARQCWFIGDRETPRESLQWPPQVRAKLADLPQDVQEMLQFAEQPAEAAPESVPAWQIVNPGLSGDLEFLAQDAWIALLSIDFNLGAEYLTDVPMTYWPVLAERAPQPDRIATVAKGSSDLGY